MATYSYTFQSGDSVTPARLNDARTVSDIVDADISSSAEIAVNKLADGDARQLLQTNAAGTGVEWTDNVDIVGTLDVTGATTLDGTLNVAGAVTTTSTATLAHGVVVAGSSAGNAVRITQEGTGNALVIEDSANPDSTPVVVDASGNTVIGHTSAVAVGGTTQPLTVNGVGATLVRAAADAFGAVLRFCKSRSTSIGAARAIVEDGDELGAVEFAADNGATLSVLGASISAEVDGIAGSADMPSRLLFSTTPDGSDTPVERMRITNGGNVGIGKTPTTKLDVDGTVTATAFSGPVTGNSSTATTLETARTIAISGDVTGTATSFNGSANIAISSAITAGSIVDADVNSGAAIALSKLATGALPTAITVASSNIVDGTIVNADISASAAIALSKLATGALPTGITVASANLVDGTVVNADISASADIAHSKLADITAGRVLMGNASNVPTATVVSGDVTINSSGVTAIGSGVIVNADISNSAAIAGTKIAPDFGSQNIVTTGYIDAGTSFRGQAGDSETAPSFTWTGDTNTGMLRPTADTIEFTVGGSAAMRINSTGAIGVGAGISAAALLDLTSTTRGLLPPRMTTTQRDAISTPPAGLMIYNTTTNKLNVRTASSWEAVTSS